MIKFAHILLNISTLSKTLELNTVLQPTDECTVFSKLLVDKWRSRFQHHEIQALLTTFTAILEHIKAPHLFAGTSTKSGRTVVTSAKTEVM